MDKIFLILQLITSIFLIVIILIQVRGQSVNIFGGGGDNFRTRRGFEKILFQLTIIVSVIFVSLGLINAALS
ncbi:MAG: preprotein translocase subunit SecG [SAR202 cluster bacterium]|uniref:Protein-export membrane protein SecG n=1 Tax=marine metagenome TaxID=408172 RepID=A0A383B238_9ZZZZ|nr:preprotein translocase subunit SecG [Chloroflexota bacterium]MQG06370.1 preprotein translocase subunit SecG [SAR202 cluster bacterium]